MLLEKALRLADGGFKRISANKDGSSSGRDLISVPSSSCTIDKEHAAALQFNTFVSVKVRAVSCRAGVSEWTEAGGKLLLPRLDPTSKPRGETFDGVQFVVPVPSWVKDGEACCNVTWMAPARVQSCQLVQ